MFAGCFTAWVQNGGEGFVQGLGCFRLRDDESSRTVGHVLVEVGLCCHPETQVMLLMLEIQGTARYQKLASQQRK